MAKVNRCAAHVYNVKDTEWGPIITLPLESKLEIIDQFGDLNGRWLQVKLVDGTTGYLQRGDVAINAPLMSREEMLAFSFNFLDMPYTWGGRSSFGYDCSGFVQMLYRQMGIALPRDSKDQAKWEGFHEIALEDMQPGDLVFFGSASPKISHIGMWLGDGLFIHTSSSENKPYMRVSRLADPYWNGTGPVKHRIARALNTK